MITCPSCAAECPDGSRFCLACGSPLSSSRGASAERKIVTILFADLVGYTALCERHDPEDVDVLLREFYRVAREVIETYGGVVEKFIGDAVVGVFGVPSVHEDDAVRAVHTALRLLECVPELPMLAGETIQVRIGINTGPAVIRLDVHPRAGEGFLVGDAVNTAARLQSQAPPMGIVVGARTRELSARAMVYEALPPAALKGKADAVPCFIARGPRGRTGIDPHQRFTTPLVDREVELAVLGGLLDKTFASSEPQVAVLVAEAGMGKSRLVAELARSIEDRPSIVQWRMGRCPSYGEGLTFWAVGEIVRAHLGVLESDDAQAVRARLDDVLPGEADREWLTTRLLALLGFDSAPASRDENFAAWLRFLELIARDHPTVVVFEDLHWASEATLSFVVHVLEHAQGVPLLVLATTRPELFDARPDLADRLAGESSARHVRRLDLHPLSEREATRLVDLIGGFEGLSETRAAIVRRSAGNPLYAEELVRLLADAATAPGRPPDATLETAAESALPDSLHSLIAARLDALEPEQKALLSDAAVVGQVFWIGAVAALDHGDVLAVGAGLKELVKQDFIRPHPESSLAEEPAFAFRHALIRDVAYGQLTRHERATKHAAVGDWIETTTGDRTRELADVLAHHFATAFELSERAGERVFAAGLRLKTISALQRAGDQALPLDVPTARQFYALALRLAGDGPERAGLLAAWGRTRLEEGFIREAADALAEGVRLLRLQGHTERAALAEGHLVDALWLLADPEARRIAERTVRSLATEQPGPELLGALANWAAHCAARYDDELALDTADKVLDALARLNLPTSAKALGWRGLARCHLGDRAGLDDLRAALELGKDQGLGSDIGSIYANLADELQTYDGPATALAVRREGLAFCIRRGDATSELALQAGEAADLVWAGRWDEAVERIHSVDSLLEQRGQTLDLASVRALWVLVHTLRGDTERARDVETWLRQAVVVDPVNLVEIHTALATYAYSVSSCDESHDHLVAVAEVLDGLTSTPQFGGHLPIVIRLAADLGDFGLAAALAAHTVVGRRLDVCSRLVFEALEHERSRRRESAAAAYAAAVDAWGDLGLPYERAMALLGLARCLAGTDEGERAAWARAESDRLLQDMRISLKKAETVSTGRRSRS